MSTDLIRRLDGQLEPDRYGATSHSSESALFSGYRSAADTDPRTQQRPCVCGGIVTADPDAPARGVGQHNTIGRHQAWRAAMGFDLAIEERP